jgi:acetyltransferase-like isoleucine patch superfamily enzyme
MGVRVGENVTIYGAPLVHMHRGSVIEIGDSVVLCSDSRRTALSLNHPVKIATVADGASLLIGADTGISGATLVSARSITIGREVLLGANVTIVDTDFHPIIPENRRHSDDIRKIGTLPVVVGDNVFIGANSIILKGANIGKDSVVAAGSVVVRGNYPLGAILAGNPAKVIGSAYQQ